MTSPSIPDQGEAEIDQILCDLHDLGFYGDSLAHLEKLAYYIAQERMEAEKQVAEYAMLTMQHNSYDATQKLLKILIDDRRGKLTVPSPQTPEMKDKP